MNEKKRVSLTELLSDIQSGLGERELMEKHDLSVTQLDKVYAKLVESGRLTQAEVDARKGSLDDVLEFDEGPTLEPQSPAGSSGVPGGGPPLPPPGGSGGSLPPQPENWQKKAAVGILGGIAIGIVGGILAPLARPSIDAQLLQALFVLMWLAGTALQVWGCHYLVKGKGYHGAYSILGVLCCIGLLILLVLPSKYGDARTSGALIVLIVATALVIVVAITGIILAIAVPYYISYKRTSCDRVASADVGKLGAALERLGNEVVHRKLRYDEEAVSRMAEANALQYLVGPYYGFAGTTARCSVLIRMNRLEGKWVVEGTSLKGSHPSGLSSRYIYRVHMAGGHDLPATIGKDAIDARNGHSLDWNSYPYAPAGQQETCYTESIVGVEGPAGNQRFSVKVPHGVPCSTLLKK